MGAAQSKGPSVSADVLVALGCALAAALLLFSLDARAQQRGLEVQAETGKCEYQRSPDGMFWQGKFQTNNQLSPGCSSFALAGLFDDTIGWRVAYHDFGTIRARDNRFLVRDDEYAHPPSTPCDVSTGSGCYGTMYGEGRNRGVSFAITKRVAVGDVDLIGEAGLLFFSSEFHAWAVADANQQTTLYVREESTWRMAPPAPMFGAGVRWKYAYLMARRFVSMDHRAQSLTDHNITEFGAGLAIPLQL